MKTNTQDIENIPNYEEYIRQKKVGGFACTYDIEENVIWTK